MNTPPFSLYLRDDGSLLIVRGPSVIEARLTPAQLLQLGMDCLQVAAHLQPQLLPAAADALAEAVIPPHLASAAQHAISESTVIPQSPPPCLLN